ncbi:MAG: BON domain-containing protein [Archangium sp.]|nr:BON domain-containing protein [Archangium sp.]
MKTTVLKAFVLGISLASLPAFAVVVPDGLITSKTKLSLWTTAGLRSTTVHVDSNDGVVTLYGKVPTSEQRDAAEKTTRAIVGVTGVRNLLQIVPASQAKQVEKADKDTQALAEKTLKADAALKDSKITVKSVDKGVVLLAGDAKTFSDHLRAVVIVDRLVGVRRVASEVKGPDAFGADERITFITPALPKAKVEARNSATDMRISMAVKMRLLTAAQVPSNEISVDTEDNVVTLFGIVPTAAVSRAAATEAGKVAGVIKVENQLEIVATSQKEKVDAKDDDITRDLALAFKDRPELKGVVTSVKNGTVQLSGSVPSGWDEVNALRIARKVSGVRGVEDQLKIDDKA